MFGIFLSPLTFSLFPQEVYYIAILTKVESSGVKLVCLEILLPTNSHCSVGFHREHLSGKACNLALGKAGFDQRGGKGKGEGVQERVFKHGESSLFPFPFNLFPTRRV